MEDLRLPPMPETPAGSCEVDCGPDAATGGRVVRYEDGYSADQLREYGRACFEAGMERAAVIAEALTIEGGVKLFDRGYNGAISEVVAAIRQHSERKG